MPYQHHRNPVTERRDVVVVGASAGGVEALSVLARSLPADFSAAVLVVLHLPRVSTSRLPEILGRAGPLPAQRARQNERIEPGRIYVAPPDSHLLVRDARLRLGRGPLENGHRPAIDPLFRTAAREFGRRVIGVILSGTLDDGTAGLAVVRTHGGLAVAQDPADALYGGMAQSVLHNVGVDYVASGEELGVLLSRLTAEPLGAEQPRIGADRVKAASTTTGPSGIDVAEMDPAAIDVERAGVPSGFACPNCNGVLWEDDTGERLHFRCRVGHAWSAESLIAEQAEGLEVALWATLRTLREKAALARRLAHRAAGRGHVLSAEKFELQASEADETAAAVEKVIAAGQGQGLAGIDDEEEPFRR